VQVFSLADPIQGRSPERITPMIEWWNDLGTLNQAFYGVAFAFTILFVWQFISSLIGLAGGAEIDVEVDTDVDVGADGLDLDNIEAHSLEEAAETAAAFKLFSLRALLAFCMMFSWASALYLNIGKPTATALLYAFGWGLAGWAAVAVMMALLKKLTETGTQKVASCVGKEGAVYLHIPSDGQGEVRVMVSGRVTMLKARSTGGREISPGTPIRVARALDPVTVEVEPIGTKQDGPEDPAGKENDK